MVADLSKILNILPAKRAEIYESDPNIFVDLELEGRKIDAS